MSRRVVLGLVAIVLVLAVSWSFAQKPAEEGKPAPVAGRYTVAPLGNTAVMLDTTTGNAWVLTPAAEGEPSAWLPTVRLENNEEVQKWRARQRSIAGRLER